VRSTHEWAISGALRLCVWYASAHTLEVLNGLLSIGFELASQVIWDKTLFSIGRSWYHWAHEPCFVVRQPGAKVPLLRRAQSGHDLACTFPLGAVAIGRSGHGTLA
jgi:hypothetical protein